MSKFYFHEVVDIVGKGLGCIASKDIKKNTVILQEHPQILIDQDDVDFESWVAKLLYQFNRMSKTDQRAFMKLHVRQKNPVQEKLDIEFITSECIEAGVDAEVVKKELIGESKTSIRKAKLCQFFNHHAKTADDIMKIVDIYECNSSEYGLNIQRQYFNHSCLSNTECQWYDGQKLANKGHIFVNDKPTFHMR